MPVEESSHKNESWRARPGYMLAVLTAVNAVNWADRQVVPILFPSLKAELGLTDTQLGIVGGAAFSIIYALSSFVFGRAADYRVRRTLIAIGLAIWSVATAASGLTVGFTSLFAARFFTGIGEASLYPSAMSLLAQRYPAEKLGRAMGIFGSAAAVGGGIGIAAGGALSDAYGWRAVFYIYGAAGLLLIPAMLSVPEQPRPAPAADAERPGKMVLEFLRDKRLMSLWMAGMIMMAAGIGYSAWVPTYFVRVRNMDVSSVGLMFGVAIMIGGIVGSILGGLMADRRRRLRFAGELEVSTVAALLAIPLAALTLTATSLPVIGIAAICAPVAIFAFFPSMQTMIMEIVPSDRHGLVYAVNILFLGGIGSAFGPFVVGRVSDATGSVGAAMAVPIVGFALASLLAMRAGRIIRASEDRKVESG